MLPRFERTLDRLQGIYGSHNRMGIWSTEYGYQTKPPASGATVSPAEAAVWINWAEYLSYKQSRHPELRPVPAADPPPHGNFASGLEFPNGKPKADVRRVPDAAVPADHVDPEGTLARGVG